MTLHNSIPTPAFGRRMMQSGSGVEGAYPHRDSLYATSRTKTDRDPFRFSRPYYDIRTRSLAALFSDARDDELEGRDRTHLYKLVASYVSKAITPDHIVISPDQADLVVRDLIDDLIGFGPLEHLLHRDDISDIMVIGPKLVFYEYRGKLFETDIQFEDEAHLIAMCQRITRRIGRRVDESSPMCDARLPDGSRVNIVVPPLAIDGTALTIRKFHSNRLNFDGLLAMGALDQPTIALLKLLVSIRCNIIVVGGTGSGKTTLLNSLNQSLSAEERIVTCEDAAELQLQQRHIVRLETRPQNLEGTGEINMRALVRNSLRMRPDRIIVGEVRGEEAFDFIQAMNTGHDGSMGTMHANSAKDALSRLEGLISLGAPSLPVRTIQNMMTSALDIIVEMRRFRDGSRRLANILEILDCTDAGIETQSILEFIQAEFSGDTVTGQYRHNLIGSKRIRRKADHAGRLADLDRLSS